MRNLPLKVARYKVEPYVVPADVYALFAAYWSEVDGTWYTEVSRLDVPSDCGIVTWVKA